MSGVKFEVGDQVQAWGLRGEIIFVDPAILCINVRFENGYMGCFTKDGKANTWHALPSLTLVSKAKKKVERWLWVIKRGSQIPEYYTPYYWYTENEAQAYYGAENIIGKDPNCIRALVTEE